MEIYKNSDGVDCVLIFNEDGSSWSGLKSAYDDQQAANSGSSVPNDPLATADSVSPSSIVP